MKKLFAFISVLAACVGLVFADVTVKDLGGGNVEVTFFYGNPRASEVVLAGDFTNWLDGAWPMEKTEKGFTLTHTFKVTDELRYKFVSDGNWTTDLKAPDFVDDGFGGKNSHVVIADMVGGGDDAGAAKAKINFISWSMIGLQGNFLTRDSIDKTKEGFDLDSVTFGMKSYNKFAGNFLPNCPVYIEIALAEKEMEDYDGNTVEALNYLYRRNPYGGELVSWEDGIKDFVKGIARPVEYAARANDNTSASAGPGSNPFLGHLKFGFNTPYIKYVTGFNYAKPDVRQAVIWKTIDGNWDAGYNHVGGFNVFSLGDKPAAFIEENAGIKLDVGFAPNKTADRKGTKYGYWGWVDVKKDDLTIDFQTNGMYNSDYIFYDPVEHDFIIGAKMDNIAVGDGKLNFALQALIATHQKTTQDILDTGAPNMLDYFGYSTDVWYRDTEFNGLQNLAGALKVGYKNEMLNIGLGYRMRGMQASMLYLRENHDDGTFDLSAALGVLNSHAVNLDAGLNLLDGALGINLGVTAEFALSELKSADTEAATWNGQKTSWWESRRFIEDTQPLFDITGGTELGFKPAVSYKISDAISISAYGDLKLNAYSYAENLKYDSTTHKQYNANEGIEKYGCSNSTFKFEKAGLALSMTPDSDVIKGVNVYYGLDLSNNQRIFNTLVGKVMFPSDITVNLALGLKTENTAGSAYLQDEIDRKNAYSKEPDEDYEFKSDEFNIFSFAVGFSKKLASLKKPVVYAQFCFNMDPFAHFGNGQDALNMDRSNIKGSYAKEGVGKIDPVDWYEGRAAVRVGIRWDI